VLNLKKDEEEWRALSLSLSLSRREGRGGGE
jgi:hypothetical protein